MLKYAGLLGAVALAGCTGGLTATGGGGGTTPASGGKDTCGAAAYTGLIGQDSVVTLQIPDPKRSYRTDEAVPTDFNAERISVVLDETDVIIAVTCG